MTTVPDFDRMYASDPDPWQVATSWYERRKIDIALACLRRPRYRFAWDAACGTGDLAARLADRCDAVLASDASAQACALTAARCARVPQVRVEQSALPALPARLQAGPRVGPGPDLVVLSELLYYLDDEARARTAARVADVAAPEADLLAVHWTPQPEDAHLSGVRAHRELDDTLRAGGWGRLVSHQDTEFVLTLWSRDLPTQIGR